MVFTGDTMSRDADGYFYFAGRNDDIITSSGYRIGPFDVESVMIEHPAVAEVAVIGKPDPERTEIVKSFVVLPALLNGLLRVHLRPDLFFDFGGRLGLDQGGHKGLPVWKD